MIERKWEWISNRLKELNLNDLSKTALKFDIFLKETYNIKSTNLWFENYEDVNNIYNKLTEKQEKTKYIDEISNVADYCPACIIERLCQRCKFHKEGLGCDKSTIFAEFIIKLREIE